jgi:hypothetical protein
MHTWGWELDPRLNQPDIYCEKCEEPCGRGAQKVWTPVGDYWLCAECAAKELEGPQSP